MLELVTYNPIRDGLAPVHQAALEKGQEPVLNSLFKNPAEWVSTNALQRLISALLSAGAAITNTNSAQTDGQGLASHYLVNVEALGQYLQTQQTAELAGARK